jgi:transposase
MPPRGKIWDDQLVDQIVQYIEVGNYLTTACAAVGIGESTYHYWLRKGYAVEQLIETMEDAEDLKEEVLMGVIPDGLTPLDCRYYWFRDKMLTASARSEAYAVAMVRKHMPDQWTAAMTYLERRFPGRWKRKEQIDIMSDNHDGIDETLVLNDPEAVKLVHDALERVALNPGVVVTDVEKPADESAG